MKSGYKYSREACPHCGKMVADNWWVRHMRTHYEELSPDLELDGEEPLMVGLTAQAQLYLLMTDNPGQPIAQTVEEALRIYTYLGSFIDLMVRHGILEQTAITGQKRPPI